MTKQTLFSIAFFLLISALCVAQKHFELQSPDSKLSVRVTVGQSLVYSVSHAGEMLLEESPVSMTLGDGRVLGEKAVIRKATTKTVDGLIDAPLYKRAVVRDHYNELTLQMKGDYNIIFRAYDDGVAYRLESISKKPVIVQNEQVEYNFPHDYQTYTLYVRPTGYHKDNMHKTPGSFEDQFFKSFVNLYTRIPLSKWDAQRLVVSPTLIKTPSGKNIALLEADLLNYPGMYLNKIADKNSVRGVFAPYPKKIRQGGKMDLQGVVDARESYIARYEQGVKFPWRAFVVVENDAQLADNDMVFKLATPNQLGDISWIIPGKSAWEWWNDWNLFDVDFRAGVNNETYRFYIDFAAENGLDYLVFDEGWSVEHAADLFQVVPELDLPALVSYANSKNIGVILWVGYYAFARDIEAVCKHFAEMGIKGFKIDFMDRDDQLMVDFHQRAAKIAAKYKLLLDFHGTYKPTGLHRTYPNAITFEAVQGMEHMKWAAPSVDQVTHDVTIPFIRMLSGPLDFTQGAMRNATKINYKPLYSEPMSQGTRCRQIAQYVIYESPLSMLCDNPQLYRKEQETLDFMAGIPTVWDNTIAINGIIAEYVTIARLKGEEWYVGAITNWDARSYDIDLSFLGEGNYEAEVFKDGINADRMAQDYKKEILPIPNNRKVSIKMAPGGGYAMRIYKVKAAK